MLLTGNIMLAQDTILDEPDECKFKVLLSQLDVNELCYVIFYLWITCTGLRGSKMWNPSTFIVYILCGHKPNFGMHIQSGYAIEMTSEIEVNFLKRT